MAGREVMDGQDDRAHAQIEAGTGENGADTAEAVQEGLGNAAAKKRQAHREAADQDGRGAQGSAQLDEASLDPGGSGHRRYRYIGNVSKNQGKRMSAGCWGMMASA